MAEEPRPTGVRSFFDTRGLGWQVILAVTVLLATIGGGLVLALWESVRDEVTEFLTTTVEIWHLLIAIALLALLLVLTRSRTFARPVRGGPPPAEPSPVMTRAEQAEQFERVVTEVRDQRIGREELQSMIRENTDDALRAQEERSNVRETVEEVLSSLGMLAAEEEVRESRELAGLPSVAIDLDTSGNDARLGGGATVTHQRSVTVGDSFDIDIVVPPPGIPENRPLVSFQMSLRYDPGVVNVVGCGTNYLIAANPGSSIFPASDPVPDSDGSYTTAALDVGVAAGETGPGVLSRITLEAVGVGTTELTLQSVGLISGGEVIPLAQVSGATVVVEEPAGS